MVAAGPGDATAAGEAERMDGDVEAAKQAWYIAALEPAARDLNGENQGAMEVSKGTQGLLLARAVGGGPRRELDRPVKG